MSSAWAPRKAASTPTVDAALTAGAARIHCISLNCGGAHPANRADSADPGSHIREMRPYRKPMPSLVFKYLDQRQKSWLLSNPVSLL